MTPLAPALLWTGRAFEPGLQISLADGAIGPAGPDARPLPRAALLPGFVNAHSHAFQRGLRGRGERFPGEAGSFWSWREAMYGLVESMTPDHMYTLTRQCYDEMRDAGVTTVGEFHYLHHDASGAGFALDDAVLAAAHDAGLRLVLLQACYMTGDLDGSPLSGGQRRFATPDLDTYWAQLDRLADRLHPTQSLGVVAHSVRAVPADALAALHAGSVERGLPFHLHLEEQPREIASCRAVHGVTPMRLLLDRCAVDGNTSAVHCTHSDPAELAEYAARGGRVLVCPTTEANLGDGLPPLDALAGRLDRLCLGTDSNARISMIDEMRWLEYGQRWRTIQRGLLRDDEGRVAPTLLAAATTGGAASLGIDPTGDAVLVDLDEPSLAHVDLDTLAEAICFGARDTVVANSAVAGSWRAPLPG